MALIECSECNKQISDSAEFCPHCGHKPTKPPQPAVKNKPSGCSIVMAIFMLFGVYGAISSVSEGNKDKIEGHLNSTKIINNSFPIPESCSYLESLDGYTPGGYTAFSEGSAMYMCGTPYKEIGSHPNLELANNIAYYVKGDAVQGTELKIMLNVNQKNNVRPAKVELLKAASVIYAKTHKSELPQKIKNSITKGTPGIWGDEKYVVKLEKNFWPTNEGYEINFIISVK